MSIISISQKKIFLVQALNETNSNASDLAFNTNVRMVMINGSASHTHAITNFNLTNDSEENGVKTFNGTS